MANSVLEALQALTTPEFVRTTARQLGASEGTGTLALTAAGTMILSRLAGQTSNTALMHRVASLIEPSRQAGKSPLSEGSVARTGAAGGVDPGGTGLSTQRPATNADQRLGRGTALLNVVFGPRLQTLVEALSAHCMISAISARAAIGHAAPLVLKALGQRLDHISLAPAGLAPSGSQLAELLSREREAIGRAAPAGLVSALDAVILTGAMVPRTPASGPAGGPRPTVPTGSPRPSVTASATTAHGLQVARRATIAADPEIDSAGLGAPALIGGLGGLAVLWWLFQSGLTAPYAVRPAPVFDPNSRTAGLRVATPAADQGPVSRNGATRRADERIDRPSPRADVPNAPFAGGSGGTFSSATSTTPSSTTVPAAITGLLRFIKRTLPSNKQIDFVEEGIEARMIGLIENRNLPLERTQWFEFDRLHFHTGSSNLTSESRAQVQNIADILSSYPSVRIKIGGYTDNVGDAIANQRLSEARAQRVMTELITLGVNALRLEAEGYGEQHPIADNASSEGRARNRRIAIRVTER